MHIDRITVATSPKPADHGLQQDLATVSLFLKVIEQLLALFAKGG